MQQNIFRSDEIPEQTNKFSELIFWYSSLRHDCVFCLLTEIINETDIANPCVISNIIFNQTKNNI
jgi:hypothetical protein